MQKWKARTMCLAGVLSIPILHAQSLTTLASLSGSNGVSPAASLILGADGNFYGTTEYGGSTGSGTIFKINTAGTVTTIYSFSGPDGANPIAPLLLASDGNFYGTTESGGSNLSGTIFKITPGGALTTIHTFTGPDGASPAAALIQSSDGTFYGTTTSGGAYQFTGGSIFKITPAGSFTLLHSFCPQGSCTDGQAPSGALLQASDGNLYGTTSLGGKSGDGTVFKMTTGGTLITLYNFSGPDGSGPLTALVQGKDGSLYGTTNTGGANGDGSIFKITPAGTLATLHFFGASASDGANPYAPLIFGSDGNLYGTSLGGLNGGGQIFEITTGGAISALYDFCKPATCSGGWHPMAALLQAPDGSFYGTTENGGTNFDGTIFHFTITKSSSVYTCTNNVPPVISSIVSASSYGGYPYFTSGSWLEIKGTNMADAADPRLSAAVNPGQWTLADFNGVNAPTVLDGISVSINGKPAYMWYLSTGQLNVQAPEDATVGNIAIAVTNCNVTSQPFMLPRQAHAPGLLAPANFYINGKQYMVATFAADGLYALSASAGAALGIASRPAKANDILIAYGVGFGEVTPALLPGVIEQQGNSLVNPVTVSFGSVSAPVPYQGLAPNFVGLYEFYIQVPAGLANGDYQINVAQSGVALPQTMFLTVQN